MEEQVILLPTKAGAIISIFSILFCGFAIYVEYIAFRIIPAVNWQLVSFRVVMIIVASAQVFCMGIAIWFLRDYIIIRRQLWKME